MPKAERTVVIMDERATLIRDAMIERGYLDITLTYTGKKMTAEDKAFFAALEVSARS